MSYADRSLDRHLGHIPDGADTYGSQTHADGYGDLLLD
jgi:hypothetical protein